MATIPWAFHHCVLLVVLYVGNTHSTSHASMAADVYDLTEYRAATANTWRAACDSTAASNTAATLLVPNASFAVGAIEFTGPCGNNGDAPVVVVEGVLQPAGGHRLSGDAWITFSGLNNLLVTGDCSFDGQGDHIQTTKQGESKPTTLVFEDVTNSTVRGLRFVKSRGFHVNIRHCSRVVAVGLHIRAPTDSCNTDGIHVGASSHVRILNSVIGTGDDCVSVGPGSTDIVVNGVACGPGHRISVGSLGNKGDDEDDVHGVLVKNCTVRGTMNGVRIKTWPGSPPSRASNITFEDITMTDVSNPIIIDQEYCPHDECSGDKISDVMFKHIDGVSRSKVAVQLLCSKGRPCTRIHLVNISLSCGDQPCHTKFINMRGTPPSPEPTMRLEEADVASGRQQSRQ